MYYTNNNGTFIATKYSDYRELPELIKSKIVHAHWDSHVVVQTIREKVECKIDDWIVIDCYGNAEVYTDEIFTSKFIPVESINNINNNVNP